MSKLVDIKNRIDQLDGGSFQNLCDAYLSYKGYANVYSLGMKTGTNKTAPGSPDAYSVGAENKYVFVMYTTQKTDFIKKAIEDINKCLDSKKTGIFTDAITEIIYCHTYDRLEPKDDQCLRQYCNNHNILLKIIGIDKLGQDIFQKYPILAQDFLGINISSGQILPLDAFITKHDANQISAPLDTKFHFREQELKEAQQALSDCDVLLVTGPAGVGKTRFALELCQQLNKVKNYTIFIIKNNNLQLYEDLTYAIEKNKDYLVVVDDANELSGLQHILNYLTTTTESPHISKLILTVRDYAHKQVMQKVLEIATPQTIKIPTFNDNEIQTLIKTHFGITNPIYTDHIIRIAEGNARLAMLAGKLATNSDEGFMVIRDASELYHNYYHNQLNNLIESKTGLYSAGIIAFIQSVHLDYLEKLQPIFDNLKITSDDFKSDLSFLHEAELVDLCNDKAAKISDQSFSNFLIKYVFIETKIIPLSTMIEVCFPINNSRTIEACNILLNIFSNEKVKEYVVKEIKYVWDKFENDKKIFLPFSKAFHIIDPTKTFLFLQELIDNEEFHPFNAQPLINKMNKSNIYISDDILQIIGNYIDHPDLSTALELLLLYYQKRPDLFEQFYHTLTRCFEVNLTSQNFNYLTQRTVVEQLCKAVNTNIEDDNLTSLFICVAEHFLKLNFQKVEGCRQNKISIYSLILQPDKPVLEYRKLLLIQLYQIYQHGKMQTEIENFLYRYDNIFHFGKNINLDIVKAEFNNVLNFFFLFQPENLYHCVIAKHIEKIALKINYDTFNMLMPFFNSEKFKIYSILALPTFENFIEGHEQDLQRNKNIIYNLIKDYTPQEIDYLIQICSESHQTFDKEEPKLGLMLVFEILQNQEQLYLYSIEAYIKANTPYNINAEPILKRLFDIMPAAEVKKIITKHKYNQQNTWLWIFYTGIPKQQISAHWTEDLLHYLDTPDTSIQEYTCRNINSLQKYEVIEPKILFKALRIISNHYQEYPFIFRLYVFNILNHTNQQSANKILNKFYNELPLLKEIYLKGISNNTDYNGTLLYAIISVDPTFLYEYINCLITIQEDQPSYNIHHYTVQILKIWDTEQFIQLADNIFNYMHDKIKEIGYVPYQSPLTMILSNETTNQEITTKQDKWIKHTIELYSNDAKRMFQLFSSIHELPRERRKIAIEKFLSINSDPEIFEKLPLEPSVMMSYGSMIPSTQKRIDFLRSLLPFVTGVKYLKQRQHIEKKIKILKEEIRSIEIEELLES